MFSEPITIYKLMILYMLSHVNFPLTNSQLSDFFISYNYTTYFIFQQAINELVDSSLIQSHTYHGSTTYDMTSRGEDTIKFFGSKINPKAIEDMNAYLKRNNFKFVTESSNIAEYYQNSDLDYIVHFEVREGRTKLITLELSAMNEQTAKHMCDKWRDKSSDIYKYIITNLLE